MASMISIVAGGVALVLGAMYALDCHRRRLIPSNIPMVKGHVFFFGLLFEAQRNQHRVFDWFLEITRELGDTWGFYFPHRSTVFTANVANVQHMLGKEGFERYEKGALFQKILRPALGDGIFNSNGEQWRQQRKTASHFFSARSLHYAQQVFIAHTHELIELLKVNKGKVVKFDSLMCRLTLDCFGEVAFGLNIDSLHADVEFSNAFERLIFNLSNRGVSLMWMMPLVGRLMPQEREIAADEATIRRFAAQVIRSRRLLLEDSAHNDHNSDDLLSYFLNDQSDVYLIDLVRNFVVAGRDTVCSTLAWLFHYLDETLTTALRLEIDTIRAEKKDEHKGGLFIPTMDDLKQQRLLRAAVWETLRLAPPVAKNAKNAIKDDVWPDGTHIERGTLIVWMSYVLGRSRLVFGDDADDFRPHRWLQPTPPPVDAFVPFNFGPRRCLGERMAYIEIMTVASMLLTCGVELRRDPRSPLPSPAYTNCVTFKPPPGGIEINIQ